MGRPLLTRHQRQASEGLDFGCGSYTSCFGTCSNSVARPRSSPANHDKSCLGVLSGLPPARLLASLASSSAQPPNLEPEGRFILSSVGRGGDEESWRRRREGGVFATGVHVWRCGCYGLLQEAKVDDVLSGGDGREQGGHGWPT